jgi:hypothetical protein
MADGSQKVGMGGMLSESAHTHDRDRPAAPAGRLEVLRALTVEAEKLGHALEALRMTLELAINDELVVARDDVPMELIREWAALPPVDWDAIEEAEANAADAEGYDETMRSLRRGDR